MIRAGPLEREWSVCVEADEARLGGEPQDTITTSKTKTSMGQ